MNTFFKIKELRACLKVVLETKQYLVAFVLVKLLAQVDISSV